jgi:hypothetical protein
VSEYEDLEDHQTTNQSNDKDTEAALGGDAVEAADYVDHRTNDFWNGEDVAMEGDADSCEGIVSNWNLLTKEFVVQAEELGKFGHFYCIPCHESDALMTHSSSFRLSLDSATLASGQMTRVGLDVTHYDSV